MSANGSSSWRRNEPTDPIGRPRAPATKRLQQSRTTGLLPTLKELEAQRVSLVALNGMAFDLTTPHGRMLATLLAGIAAAKAGVKKLGRQPGQRPKSDRLASTVLALVGLGRSYRLIGREVGLSKNTVAEIVRRSRATPLAALVLYFAAPSEWAQALMPEVALQHATTSALPTRACAAIAAVANRGARALRVADLVCSSVAIDSGNDAYPRTIGRLDDLGIAHQPYLADEAHQPIDFPSTAYQKVNRWADKLVLI